MFRFLSRSAAIAVVSFMLVLVVAPAVHARPFEAAGPARVATPSWLDAALSWLSQVVFGNQPAPQNQAPAQATQTASTLLMDSLMQPMTGSCIDPEGRPRPCF